MSAQMLACKCATVGDEYALKVVTSWDSYDLEVNNEEFFK